MASMQNSAFRQSIALLGQRRFGTFWFASLLANICTWAQQVAQPWLLLSLGASPFLLGLDAFALSAPVLLLTVVGGALADRADRRRTRRLGRGFCRECAVLCAVHPGRAVGAAAHRARRTRRPTAGPPPVVGWRARGAA